MQAGGDALEQLLVWLERDRHDHLLIGGIAADQAIVRNIGAERSRVHVMSIDVLWTPDLSRRVDRLRGPMRRGQARELAVQEDKTLVQTGVLIASGKSIHTDA